MKINVNKTKAFYTRRNLVQMQIQKYLFFVCDNGVERNSVQYTKCQHWMHKRCYGVHGSLTHKKDFTCKKYTPGVLFNPIYTGLFLHPICTGVGANLSPYLKTDW